MIFCKECNSELPDNAKFCSNCGFKIEQIIKCSDCDAVLLESAKFCHSCGKTTEASTQVAQLPSVINNDNQNTDELSYQIYNELHYVFYKSIFERIENINKAENIYTIVKAFNVDEIDIDIKASLNDVLDKLDHLAPQFPKNKIKIIIDDVASSRLSNFQLYFDQLKSVSNEMLNYEFPQGTMDSIIKGGWSGIISKESGMGAAFGSVILPGIGTLVGGVIGGWIAGKNQEREVQELLDKYDRAKNKVLEEYDKFWEYLYRGVCNLWLNLSNIKLKSFDQFKLENDKFQKYIETAQNYFENKQYDLCLQQLALAKQINSKEKRLFLLEGASYAEMEDHEKAITPLKSSIEIGINNDDFLAATLFGLGFSYLKLGKLEDAEENLKKSIAIDSSNSEAYYYLACVYALKKQEEEVKHYWRIAIDKGFNDFTLVKNDGYFENLKNTNSNEASIIFNRNNIPSFIRAICSKYKDIADCYLENNIPEKNLSNCKKYFNIPDNEKVIFVYDSTLTLFGSGGKEGMAICEGGLYLDKSRSFSVVQRNNNRNLKWDEFSKIKIKTFQEFIEFGSQMAYPVSDKETRDSLLNLLWEIQSLDFGRNAEDCRQIEVLDYKDEYDGP
jgi:Tfp pilus assembly protein PilF